MVQKVIAMLAMTVTAGLWAEVYASTPRYIRHVVSTRPGAERIFGPIINSSGDISFQANGGLFINGNSVPFQFQQGADVYGVVGDFPAYLDDSGNLFFEGCKFYSSGECMGRNIMKRTAGGVYSRYLDGGMNIGNNRYLSGAAFQLDVEPSSIYMMTYVVEAVPGDDKASLGNIRLYAQDAFEVYETRLENESQTQALGTPTGTPDELVAYPIRTLSNVPTGGANYPSTDQGFYDSIIIRSKFSTYGVPIPDPYPTLPIGDRPVVCSFGVDISDSTPVAGTNLRSGYYAYVAAHLVGPGKQQQFLYSGTYTLNPTDNLTLSPPTELARSYWSEDPDSFGTQFSSFIYGSGAYRPNSQELALLSPVAQPYAGSVSCGGSTNLQVNTSGEIAMIAHLRIGGVGLFRFKKDEEPWEVFYKWGHGPSFYHGGLSNSGVITYQRYDQGAGTTTVERAVPNTGP